MHNFERVPLLQCLGHAEEHGRALKRSGLVCVQHLLSTTGSLLEALVEAGMSPSQIHIVGKVYSSNDVVARTLQSMGVCVHETASQFPWGGYDDRLRSDVVEMWRAIGPLVQPEDVDRI